MRIYIAGNSGYGEGKKWELKNRLISYYEIIIDRGKAKESFHDAANKRRSHK